MRGIKQMLDPSPCPNTKVDRIICGAVLLAILKGPLVVFLIFRTFS